MGKRGRLMGATGAEEGSVDCDINRPEIYSRCVSATLSLST